MKNFCVVARTPNEIIDIFFTETFDYGSALLEYIQKSGIDMQDVVFDSDSSWGYDDQTLEAYTINDLGFAEGI